MKYADAKTDCNTLEKSMQGRLDRERIGSRTSICILYSQAWLGDSKTLLNSEKKSQKENKIGYTLKAIYLALIQTKIKSLKFKLFAKPETIDLVGTIIKYKL